MGCDCKISTNGSRSANFAAYRLLLVAFCCVLGPRPAAAHPMGNFSISHYTGIRIDRGYLEVLYVIDMAEIPTFQ